MIPAACRGRHWDNSQGKEPVVQAIFEDRAHAGRALVEPLRHHRERPNAVVLALPRGGVPVAFELAQGLGLPLDVFIVRKLGYPGHEEYAMGAIASGGVRVLNPDLASQVAEDPGMLSEATERELSELRRREQRYRGDRPALDLADMTVILVDDGLATGSSMRAAVQSVRQHRPERVVVAVPVASPETCRVLAREVDEIVCATTPERFSSVGRWYFDFDQTSDAEVERLLARAWRN
jgi:predicted phosphoribosyltransferase